MDGYGWMDGWLFGWLVGWRACVRACARACVRAWMGCVRAYVRTCVHACTFTCTCTCMHGGGGDVPVGGCDDTADANLVVPAIADKPIHSCITVSREGAVWGWQSSS